MQAKKRQKITRGREKVITTVAIPLFNHESTVIKTLNSILLSNTAAIELLVSDDCSSDSSHELARHWILLNKKHFYRAVLYSQQQNQGICGNVSFLKSVATGEHFTLLASDDELSAGSIQIQSEFLQKNPSVDFLFSNMSLIDFNGNVLHRRIVSQRRASGIRIKWIAIVDTIFNWGPPWHRFYCRTQSLKKLGALPASRNIEDRWFALKIIQTQKFVFINEVTFLWRWRETGFMTGGITNAVKRRDDFFRCENNAYESARGRIRLLLAIMMTRRITTDDAKKRKVKILKSLEPIVSGLVISRLGESLENTRPGISDLVS